MAAIEDLERFGFTAKWRALAAAGFPDAPRYAGLKEEIGL